MNTVSSSMSPSKTSQIEVKASKSADTTDLTSASMLANVTESILFPSRNYIVENFTPDSGISPTLISTSSGHQARASSTPLSENNCTSSMRGKKHHGNNNNSMMDESDNARHWFCNILSTGDDRACTTVVKDAAFTQLYLALAKKKFLSQQVVSNGGVVESAVTKDGMPSLLKLDKKMLYSNYTKSELSSLYENHRQTLSSTARNSKQPKSSKVVQGETEKSRKKQGRISSSDPSVCSGTLTSADSSECTDAVGISAGLIEKNAVIKSDRTCISMDDTSPSDTAEKSGACVEEISPTYNNNLGAAETIKTILDHEIACESQSTSKSSNDAIAIKLSKCKSTSGVEKDAIHNRRLHKRQIAAAKKIASRAISRETPAKAPQSAVPQSAVPQSAAPQSVVSIPNKNKKQTGKQNEKPVSIDTNKSISVSEADLSIMTELAELHLHTRLTRSTNDVTSSSNNNGDYFDSLLFDSSFLAKDNGVRFLQLADSLVQHHTHRKEGFLSTPPLKRSREVIKTGFPKMAYFPAWLKGSTDCTRTSFNHRREHEEDASKPILIPFYLLLLARIEIAIWGAYYRSFSPMQQNQGPVTNSTSNSVDNTKINNNIYNIDTVSRILQKANKLHKIGERIGLEKRQQIMDPIFSLVGFSNTQCVMKKDEKSEIEVTIADHDCLLENIIIVPWTWVIKAYQPKNNDDAKESEERAFHQILQKVYQDLNSSYANELKDDAIVITSVKAENEVEDIALSLGGEVTSSKNKKKKKKKKQKKKSTSVNTNQTAHVKPVERTSPEVILDMQSAKQSTSLINKNSNESDSSPKLTDDDNIKDENEKKK